MIVLGIDPGQTGGFALVHGRRVISALLMPLVQVRTKKALDVNGVNDWLSHAMPQSPVTGVVELVHAMPRQGVSSSFQFGRMFGAVEALMVHWCKQWDYVSPVVWKKAMGLSDQASASIDLATRVFGVETAKQYWPLKKHEGVAEAALIALYWCKANGVSV